MSVASREDHKRRLKLLKMEKLKEPKVIFNPIVFVRIITENVRKDLSYNDPLQS
jgi:hypothetical protein